MKTVIFTLMICFSFMSCVSKKKYEQLTIEKNKIEKKTATLEQKLKELQIKQQNLKDSLSKVL